MILSGSTISNVNHARKMAVHLFKDENDKVVRETINGGTEYKDFESSLISMQLMTRMTQGNTGIFHVAISPREDETLTPEQYDQAIEIIEQKFGFRNNEDGLTQPRVRIDHIKDGRAHSHVLWSLVDQDNEKLLKTSLYKRKLQDCAINMEKEFNLTPVDRTPKESTMQLTHADRMIEARNKKKNIDRLKAIERKQEMTDIWSTSENGQTFLDNLKRSGYSMANGNKMTKITVINEKGEKEKVEVPVLVVVDQYGEARNIARELPRTVKVKQVREQLGGLVNNFLSVEEVRKANAYDREQENIDRQNKELDAADQAAKETAIKPKNLAQQDFTGEGDSELKEKNKERNQTPQKPIQERFKELGKKSGMENLREKIKEREKEKDPIDIAMAQSKKWFDIIDRDREDSARISLLENKLRKDHRFDDLKDKIKDLKKDLAKSDTFLGRKTGKHQELLNELEDQEIYFEETKQRIQARVDKLKKELLENRSPELRPANDDTVKSNPEKDKSDNVADFDKAAKKKSEQQAKEEAFKERMRHQQERKAQERDKDKGMDLDI